MDILTVKNLNFRINEETVLSDINFTLRENTVTALLGNDIFAKRVLARLIGGGYTEKALYVEESGLIENIRLDRNKYYVSEGLIPFGFMAVRQYIKYSTASFLDSQKRKELSEKIEALGFAKLMKAKLSGLSPAYHKLLQTGIRLYEDKPVIIINADDILYNKKEAAVLDKGLAALVTMNKTVLITLCDNRMAGQAVDNAAVLRDGRIAAFGERTAVLSENAFSVCAVKPRGDLKQLKERVAGLTAAKLKVKRGKLLIYNDDTDVTRSVIRALADAGEGVESIITKKVSGS